VCFANDFQRMSRGKAQKNILKQQALSEFPARRVTMRQYKAASPYRAAAAFSFIFMVTGLSGVNVISSP
jgi:hypothetical protein